MHRLSRHMLLPADRNAFDKWLVRMSVFYGSITLFIVGLLLTLQVSDPQTRNQEARMTPCPIAIENRSDRRPTEHACP